MALTVRDHMRLQFEDSYRGPNGGKGPQIRYVFDESETTYYARLRALCSRPEAEAAYPQLVRRLRRMQEARAAVRSARARGVAS